MGNYYKGNQGFTQPFTIKNADGTLYDLTGSTVTWYFKDPTGTITSIAGSVNNGPLGQCSFNIPSNFFPSVTVYTCQIVIVLGSSKISTDPPFTIAILQGADS
ncbi:MAG TPA: hypothetical protein VM577_02795 [Anaerovoracaceae bacterium]|nr:hypothetical protein [Anaerovoracaceae bacterium]